MTSYRLGTITAVIFSFGWTLAITISLSWFPQRLTLPPTLFTEADLLFHFINDNRITWQLFHIGTTAALITAIPLINYLSHLHPDDYKRPLLTPVGIIGAGAGLLASLIDQFSTPYLAQIGAGNITFGVIIWETIEPFRDNGLKTVSFFLLSLWFLWLVQGWEGADEKRPRQLTAVTGWGLLLLAIIEAAVPMPLKLNFGEDGLGGFILLLLPIWGFTIAHWLWQQELESHSAA